MKMLFERSSVWRFERRSISTGIGPVMLLLCKSLSNHTIYEHQNDKKKPFFCLFSGKIHIFTDFFSISEPRTYMIWRFVKFPMFGERVPDRYWLGVPLHNTPYHLH